MGSFSINSILLMMSGSLKTQLEILPSPVSKYAYFPTIQEAKKTVGLYEKSSMSEVIELKKLGEINSTVQILLYCFYKTVQ